MYKRINLKKLGRTHSHRKALKQNQVRSILQSGKVRTSSVKAKVLRGELESLLNLVRGTKDEDISLIRRLNEILGKEELVKKAMELGKKESTKVTVKKVGYRVGDNTQESVVEIVGFKGKKDDSKKKVAKKDVKVEKKEEVEEKKESVEKKKSFANLGAKSVSKKVEPLKKERAKSRSGL